MSKIRRTDQGGSVVGIVIIGVILTLVFIGSIYFINKRGDQIRKDQAIAAADKQAKEAEKSKTVVSSNQSKSTTATDSSTAVSTAPEILPVTGPEISISTIAGVYLLTFTATGYLSSRRQLARYL
ncbi:MAG: hypothetical protein WCH58_01375 [Candidatus Saccharibacteria bacterium]